MAEEEQPPVEDVAPVQPNAEEVKS